MIHLYLLSWQLDSLVQRFRTKTSKVNHGYCKPPFHFNLNSINHKPHVSSRFLIFGRRRLSHVGLFLAPSFGSNHAISGVGWHTRGQKVVIRAQHGIIVRPSSQGGNLTFNGRGDWGELWRLVRMEFGAVSVEFRLLKSACALVLGGLEMKFCQEDRRANSSGTSKRLELRECWFSDDPGIFAAVLMIFLAYMLVFWYCTRVRWFRLPFACSWTTEATHWREFSALSYTFINT